LLFEKSFGIFIIIVYGNRQLPNYLRFQYINGYIYLLCLIIVGNIFQHFKIIVSQNK
jgi:hypothetical protein